MYSWRVKFGVHVSTIFQCNESHLLPQAHISWLHVLCYFYESGPLVSEKLTLEDFLLLKEHNLLVIKEVRKHYP